MDYKTLPWIAGNPLTLQIPLQKVTITADGHETEDYEPQDGDTVTIILRSQRSEKTYVPEIEGNIATISDNGTLLIGEYAVETLVVESDGTKRRSYYPFVLNVMKATPDMLAYFDDFPEYAEGVMLDTPNIFFDLSAGGGSGDAYTKAQSDARYVKKVDMQAYSTTEEMLEIIRQALLGYATIQYVDEKVQQASDGRPEVIITDERNVTLEEGKYYVFGECEELTINIGNQYTDGRLNKYMFEFDSPQDAATRLSLPANLRNVPSFAIVPNSHFVVAIQGNVVSMVGTNSYYPGAGDDDFFKDLFNNDISNLVIPEGVTIIRRYLFYYNRSITNVVLPSTITNIELYAFNNCSGLTNINFPVGLATIGDRAFEACSSLVGNIVFVGLRSLGQYAFAGCSKITSVTLPECLTSIGASAFSGCAGLKSITIPSTLTVFNQNCFANTAITQISIPTGTTILPQSMFSACKQLHTVNIPNTVTLIQATVFAQDTALQRITIPNSVVELQANVFQSCSILTDITLHDSIQTVVQATSMSGIAANATVKIIGTTRVIPFMTMPNTTKVYVDATMVARYKAASGWSGIASRIFSLSDLE